MSIASLHSTASRTAPRRDSAPLAHARDHLRPVPSSHAGLGTALPAGPRTGLRTAPPATGHPTPGPRWDLQGLPPVVSAELGVPTLHRTVVDYASLDHGASTPALVSVKHAVDVALRTYSSVHRGNGHLSRVTSGWYEQARAEVADFVGARAEDHVVFTRNTTDSLNLLARSLPRRTTVLVFSSEHHATLLPWDAKRTLRLPVPASTDDAEALLEDGLRRAPSGPRLVVLTGASNVTGEYWPVERLAAVAARHGARVVLDAAQLAPHRPIDVQALGADYVVFSGHKLYAPFGAGVLVGRGDWLDAAEPYLPGGGATAEVSTRGVRWNTGPARHEGGSPNVIGAIALAAACAALASSWASVEAHEEDLGRRLQQGLAAIDGVRTYSIFGADHPRAAVVAFTIEGVESSLVSAALSAEYGIGVRDGKFCAHLLVDDLLADAYAAADTDAPGTAVRASAGLGTTVEHVERLLGAVAALASGGPAWDYTHGPQGWAPVEDPRDLSVTRPW